MPKYCRIDTGELTTADDPERGVFYANCGFYTDDWDRLKTHNNQRGGIPCCPTCGCVGFQNTYQGFMEGVPKFESQKGNAGYGEWITKFINTCMKHTGGLMKTFRKWQKMNGKA